MGLFEKIFKKQTPAEQMRNSFKTFTAYTPVFTTFSGGLYESELVRSAVHTLATHSSKLSVNVQGAAKPKLRTKLKTGPNEFQTWGQFLYRLRTILEVQNTAFIVPVVDVFGDPSGVYPILPSMCSIEEYSGEAWLRYQFSTGKMAAVKMADCGIINKFQYTDDFFGENNQALMPTMDLVEIQNQGIEEGVKSSATFRFMAKLNNFSKSEDLAKEQKRFTKENLKSDAGGVLLFPNTWTDIQQIKSSPFVVDADQMKIIRENVYDYFGVNSDVIQNRCYGDAWAAFYEGAIEPFAIQLSDVMTKMLFTERERAAGSIVTVTANRLQYLSTAEKINFATQLGDRGSVLIDEIREVFNLPELPNGEGKRAPIRGEYYFVGEGENPKDGEQ